MEVLSLEEIQKHVNTFIQYAKDHQELTFQLTRIGCGLAGYMDKQIAPMFRGCPSNVKFPASWEEYVKETTNEASNPIAIDDYSNLDSWLRQRD